MSAVAILGAGAGGLSAVTELVSRGHEVRLWNRSQNALDPLRETGGVEFEGILGEGLAKPELISTDLKPILEGVDVILVCLPTIAHSAVASAIADAGVTSTPIVLNPGHTGGALEFKNVFKERGMRSPPIAEFSTLTYVARKYRENRVTITGAAKSIRLAALPGGEEALRRGTELYPAANIVEDVLATGLANVNLVLHPPCAVLGSAWIEATGGEFTFYVEGMTPGVARVMKSLDDERLAVANAFGHDLPHLIEEMAALGTVEESDSADGDLVRAISGGEANSRIKAPDSLDHRYYREDFGHGLVPFLALAQIAGVETPAAESLLKLGEVLTGKDFQSGGRNAQKMGIAGLDKEGLLQKIRG